MSRPVHRFFMGERQNIMQRIYKYNSERKRKRCWHGPIPKNSKDYVCVHFRGAFEWNKSLINVAKCYADCITKMCCCIWYPVFYQNSVSVTYPIFLIFQNSTFSLQMFSYYRIDRLNKGSIILRNLTFNFSKPAKRSRNHRITPRVHYRWNNNDHLQVRELVSRSRSKFLYWQRSGK